MDTATWPPPRGQSAGLSPFCVGTGEELAALELSGVREADRHREGRARVLVVTLHEAAADVVCVSNAAGVRRNVLVRRT